MLNRRMLLLNTGLAAIGLKLALSAKNANADETFAVTHTDAEWQSLLSSDQYAVLRKEATERPFTSPLLNEHRKGNFACAGCDLESFASTTKFDSGTGWPSFWAPIDNKVVGTTRDSSFGMVREAVHCGRCGGMSIGGFSPPGPSRSPWRCWRLRGRRHGSAAR